MVPERLNRGSVATSGGSVELPWESREQLLRELRDNPSAERVVREIEDVGASAPATLTPAEKALLIEVIGRWAERVSVSGLPVRVWISVWFSKTR